MKKEIRKEIRFSEEEYKLFTEVQEKLSLNTFADFIRYSINYFLKDEKAEEYNRKILQHISQKVDLNEKFLFKYMKIIAKSQVENLDNAKLEIEKEFENEMKSRLVKKNFELH